MGHGHIFSTTDTNEERIRQLLGNPGKAVLHLAVPIFFSLAASGLLHLTDMIWVSGLGPDALSAVGFFVPLYIVASALASGLGVGAGTCIAQRIGARDRKGADRYAANMFIIMGIAAILMTFLLILLTRPVFSLMGADRTLGPALSYAGIMSVTLVCMLFCEGAYAVFRSEGNAGRVMRISVLGVGINMVLDPVLIYGLGLGVEGAAWASAIATGLTVFICWLFIFVRRDTYVSVRLNRFSRDRGKMLRIVHLGVPVSLSQVLMAVMIFAIIKVITWAGGEQGVAVFSTGLRYMHFLVMPLAGIASALTTVTGAAYGAKDREKISAAYSYSLKAAVLLAGIMLGATFIFAPYIALMFTWSQQAAPMTGELIRFLRIVFVGHPALAAAMVSGSLFIGIGKAVNSLWLEIARNILLTIPLISILGILLDYGLPGIWAGMVLANLGSAVIAMMWVKHLMKGL